MKPVASISAAITAFMLSHPSHAGDTVFDLANLQVVMQPHIDSHLIDGAMHKVDFDEGEVIKYYATEAQAMVMSLGEDCVPCTDLAGKDGNSVPVDFYITRAGDGYKVDQTEIDDRAPLRSLMDKGLVKRIR